MELINLSLDEYLSWRRLDKDVRLRLSEGDPVVLSMSKNGHDAEAKYLRSVADVALIDSGCWFTAETLGVTSTVEIDPGDYKEELASAEWRPSPRRARHHYKTYKYFTWAPI